MIKGKKYPYMEKTKQINMRFPISIWEAIEREKEPFESMNWFIKRAIIQYIQERKKQKKNKLFTEVVGK